MPEIAPTTLVPSQMPLAILGQGYPFSFDYLSNEGFF